MSTNLVILVGHLGADPEVRTTPSGQTVANLRVATTKRVKDKEGNWGDRTSWHSVVVWGKAAEACGKFLSKGRQVYIQGELETRSWDKDGVKQYKTEVVVSGFDGSEVKFLGGGGQREGGGQERTGSGGYSGGGGGYGSGGQRAGNASPPPADDPPPYTPDDDIPF